MSYTIKVSEDKLYIIVVTSGELTNEISMQQSIEASELGAKLSINRYLFDHTNCRYVESPINHYEFVNKEIKSSDAVDPHARIAAFVHPEDHSHDFIETVSRNAGVDVTLFRDRDEAIQHLIHDI
ncbi:MAG: hypothetical protein JEZ00_10405 [Anaerolineaceae bacterium]|nr:hypothetical protein [Anaerolineaceae bacterium]